MTELTKLTIFDNYHIITEEIGQFTIETTVVDTSLNLYGKAHGGYLFALADEISGRTVFTTGKTAVTLQSSINYIKAANLGDILTVSGNIVHQGRTTIVVDVTISNQADALIAKGSFTMFMTEENPTT